MGKVRMVVALVGLVAGCGRTVTGPEVCVVDTPVLNAQGDTLAIFRNVVPCG